MKRRNRILIALTLAVLSAVLVFLISASAVARARAGTVVEVAVAAQPMTAFTTLSAKAQGGNVKFVKLPADVVARLGNLVFKPADAANMGKYVTLTPYQEGQIILRGPADLLSMGDVRPEALTAPGLPADLSAVTVAAQGAQGIRRGQWVLLYDRKDGQQILSQPVLVKSTTDTTLTLLVPASQVGGKGSPVSNLIKLDSVYAVAVPAPAQ